MISSPLLTVGFGLFLLIWISVGIFLLLILYQLSRALSKLSALAQLLNSLKTGTKWLKKLLD